MRLVKDAAEVETFTSNDFVWNRGVVLIRECLSEAVETETEFSDGKLQTQRDARLTLLRSRVDR